MKDGLELDEVVLLGRTYAEYERFFDFASLDLANTSILDIGSGVSSFCSEARQQGLDVFATDPIYELEADVLTRKCQSDLQAVIAQFPQILHKYCWRFYQDTAHLVTYRTMAYQGFIPHYQTQPQYYIASSLPHLGFETNSFDVSLVSHFLFLYEHLFDYNFHRQCILELARITRQQIRIYPLTNLKAEQSQYIEQLMQDNNLCHLQFNIVSVDFEFFKNANQMLTITV
jgi:hypothetical protein